ncbi:hypothetical protein Moror_14315 [Moniliophthora roreri MCA 2997]|uniref:Mediator of RNA polymerase II transcription subunit 19 n=2 Tax=Moniliophthora roreri TaxID=221103 RepID=V2YSQ2_MONRO|nr:hypothetical protein Moror_14315 [Moniliophthora roreri MCA 2997]KAI3615066.1 hypothetical protein WG66_017013 [Moniliophthora roreri]
MQTNAVAGPSNTHSPLYLPPPPSTHPRPEYIKSTNDLLGQFYLKGAYDKYVRPPPPTDPTSPTSFDKGKGKEVVSTPAADANDADDDEGGGKGEKKKKNTYKHLIKGVPGKHSMKKDDFLTTTIQVPPKQRVKIAPFDLRTQQEAFTVSLEGLKGWNPSALILESAQAREDRKKRKELKRLAKAQMQAQGAQAQSHPTPTASTPRPGGGSFTPSSTTAVTAPTPSSLAPRTSTPLPQKPLPTTTPRPSPHVHPQPSGTAAHSSSSTPAPTIPRPSSTSANAVPGGVHNLNQKPHVPSPVQIPGPGTRAATPLRTATPTSATAPHPLSAPPLSASSIGSASVTLPGTAPVAANQQQQPPRGKKREHDDSVSMQQSSYGLPAPPQSQPSANGTYGTNGVAQYQQAPAQQPGKPIIGARAGNNGVRPRPIKRQRMDPPIQQPTPQGA